MSVSPDFRYFGRFLKQLRTDRKWSLRQVVEAVRDTAPAADAQISTPYLSQIESGRAVRIATEKLLALRAVFGVEANLFADAMPTALRDQLRSAEDQWKVLHSRPPTARLPDELRAIDAKLDELISARGSASVALPVYRKLREFIRRTTLLSCLAAQTSRSAEPVRAFWEEHPALDHFIGSRFAVRAEWSQAVRFVHRVETWFDLFQLFSTWMIYDRTQGEQICKLCRVWDVDDPADMFACHFHDPTLDREWGFDFMPGFWIHAVRWRQIAHLLYGAADAQSRRRILKPPDIASAVDELFPYFQDRRCFELPRAETSASSVIALATAIAKRMPTLRGSRDPLGLPPLEKMLALMRPTDDPPVAPTSRRRPRRADM